MSENDIVTINIISTRGHDVLRMGAADALSEVTRQARNNNKWVFLGGELVSDLSELTIDRLRTAGEVTMSNQLVGG